MPRFFVSSEQLQGRFLVLTGENAAHAKVLRLKSGDQVTVSDGSGTDYQCTISDVSSGQISLVMNAEVQSESEPRVRCSIYMAYAKADKLEHVIQKATELGASEIVAFASSRCVSRPDEKSLAKKLERWQKIAVSAAEQSGRSRIPEVIALGSFEQAVQRAAQCDLALFPYEQEKALSLRAAIEQGPFQTASIMTGPEGGFSDDEVRLAQQYQMKVCTLGPRILRCETAPLCALSALMYASGALN